MEKLGIEPATPGLQGIALIHYTTGASFLYKVDKLNADGMRFMMSHYFTIDANGSKYFVKGIAYLLISKSRVVQPQIKNIMLTSQCEIKSLVMTTIV